MTHRFIPAGCAALALSLLAWGTGLTREANQKDREREERLLSLQAQRVARHVNADKPQYEAYFPRFLNSEHTLMRVFIYDLSGWEIGRAKYTQPPVPLNADAVRYAAPMLLRPLNGETPLAPYTNKPQELLAETRVSNRLFATNVPEAAWISEMKTSAGETWLVATSPVFNFDAKVGHSFVSAWVQAAVPMAEIDHAVRITLTASAERIQLCVTDRGIGIPAEHLPRLFNRFYRVDAARRRNDGGAGLGLAIVKTLVEAQGGSVTASSEIGVWSTFKVELRSSGELSRA